MIGFNNPDFITTDVQNFQAVDTSGVDLSGLATEYFPTEAPAWSSGGMVSNFQAVDSTPQVPSAGTFTSDSKNAFSSITGMAKDFLGMKTQYDQLQLQNRSLNLQADVLNKQYSTQASIASSSLGIANDKMQTAQIQANMQLGIAQAQSEATLAAVRSNPLASQFATGSGVLGNLSADGKISLFIGLATIWLMVRHKHG